LFEERLNDGSVRINNIFETMGFTGEATYIRQWDAPDKAVDYDNVGDPFDPTNIKFWKRRLEVKPYKYSVTLDDFDIANTGGFNIAQVAPKAAEGCNKKLDEVVIDALMADVYCGNNEIIKFDNSNVIDYDFKAAAAGNNDLNSYKIIQAHQMMRTNGVQGNIVCFASFAQLADFMEDPKVASTDFNIQPAMATGITNPYGGISGFIPTTMLPSSKKAKKDATVVDYVFAVGVDYIKIGTNFPWALKAGENPHQNFNPQILMKGQYGAVRKEENAVVVIEVAHK
jgi:hypothetical protein